MRRGERKIKKEKGREERERKVKESEWNEEDVSDR